MGTGYFSNRLGANAKWIHWIVADITEFKPEVQFDFWHDRAAFHFLTTEEDINKYISITHNALNENGQILLGTFSDNGPLKCSGLEIKQYSEAAMKTAFIKDFEVVKCFTEEHITPFNTVQHFQFCGFKKRK